MIHDGFDRYGGDVLASGWRDAGRRAVPQVAADIGTVIEVAGDGFCGAVTRVQSGTVELEDRRVRRLAVAALTFEDVIARTYPYGGLFTQILGVVGGTEEPNDSRVLGLSITPDPGVLEVNVQPTGSWDELETLTTTLYEDARAAGLALTKQGLEVGLAAPSLEAAVANEDRQQTLLSGEEGFRARLRAFLQK